ncbi:tetratricopeptide repeat protein [Kitasatospora purpeofusca]|uniref:tetratricopeptide repeat protein n=1 Tax=Kitasatospora purpeofusca TaxID=67352 RepID=UPI00225078D8|nr:tetratricopeptide repeat protein [Kitasatospora purpeofusca]MCX4687207.1 tetratricopeptide repeat protein [Kitasatospora purpeofusca]
MAKRQPNRSLAALLTESQFTQGAFARAVNVIGTENGRPTTYSQPSVSQWLNGTEPEARTQIAIIEALARRLGRLVTHAEAGFPPPLDQPTGPAGTVDGLIELGRQDMDPSRRSVLGASLFAVALTIPGWQDVLARAESIQRGRTIRIGMPEVANVIAMTEELSSIDDRHGGRAARPMAASYLVNTVGPYLKAEAPEAVRRAMMSAASDLCYLTGYMAVDEGLHGLAQRYYVKALELAGIAEDHLTYCTTLRGMSVQAVDLGHGRRAMQLADAASAAAPVAGPRMRAFLAGQQAHSAAQIGDATTAKRLIGEAERAMDRAESESRAFGSYDPSSLNYHIGQVRYELGDLAGAVESLELSDRLRHSGYRRTRVRYGALLAEWQLKAGKTEHAWATWHAVLDDYPLVQSGRADDKIRTMLGLLTSHPTNSDARNLYERARTLVPIHLAA